MERKYKIIVVVAIILMFGILLVNIEKILFLPTSSNLDSALSKNDFDDFVILELLMLLHCYTITD